MNPRETFLLLLSNDEMASVLHNIVMQEDNNVLAIYLSHVPHYRAADILDQLPTERRNKILLKITSIEQVPKREIERVTQVLVDKVNVYVNGGEWKNYREQPETTVVYSKETVKNIFQYLGEDTKRKLEKEGYHL